METARACLIYGHQRGRPAPFLDRLGRDEPATLGTKSHG